MDNYYSQNFPMEQLTIEQAELIRDCLYLVNNILFQNPIIVNPYTETINAELINETLNKLTN